MWGGVAIDLRVLLVRAEDRGFKLAVRLAIRLPPVDDPKVAKPLATEADRVCSCSNAIRGNVALWLTVNGQPVEDISAPLPARAAD
jgi:organic hydroperoxide reductase OsmC/OhrA